MKYYLYFLLFALPTAIIGNEINNSIGWAIVNFFFAPISWLKWLLCQEVNVTIIKKAFDFFLQ